MEAKVQTPPPHASTCIVVSKPHLASCFVTSVRNGLRKHLLKNHEPKTRSQATKSNKS